MGNYITQTDLETEVGTPLLVKLAGDGAGGVDATVVSACITKAESIIDSLLGAHYSTPLSTAPEIIKTCAVDLAVFRLYARKPEFTRADGNSVVQWRHREAMDLIKQFKDLNPPLFGTNDRETSPNHGEMVLSDDARGWADEATVEDDTLETW